jgi:DNA-binding MarR family transcriptional regulator
MDEHEIDKELRTFEEKHQYNWQYLAYKLRKHLDIWAGKNIKNPSGQMKQSYLPVLFNISVDGSTASSISRRSMVIKQNMSQTIGELKKIGVIVSETDSNDKRSERLDLTFTGKSLVLDTHLQLDHLQSEYAQIVGEKDLQVAVDVLLKLIAYHEGMEKS